MQHYAELEGPGGRADAHTNAPPLRASGSDGSAELGTWAGGILAALRDAVLVADPTTRRILACNAPAGRAFGAQPADLRGRVLDALYDDPATLHEAMAAALGAEPEVPPVVATLTMRGADGSMFPAEHYLIPIRDPAGALQAWAAVVQDQSARERVLDDLRATRELLTSLVETVPAPFYVQEGGLRFRLVNKAWEEVAGVSRADALGRSMYDLFPRAQADAFLASNAEVLRTGRPMVVDEILHVGGEARAYQSFKFPVRDADGVLSAMAGLSIDITERKRLEERLRLSSEVTSDYVFTERLDEAGMPVPEWASGRIAELTGYQLHELPPGIGVLPVVPEDRPIASDIMRRTRAGETVQRELRILTRSGEARWVSVRVRGIADAPGGPVTRIVGGVQDISRQREARDQLREAEQRFQALVENISDVFWLYDYNLRVRTYISPAVERIWGQTRESMEENGNGIVRAIHRDDRAAFFKSVELQQRGERSEVEYRVIRPDGSIRWVFDRGFPIEDAGGGFRYAAGLITDITDPKRVLDELNVKNHAMRTSAAGIALADLDGRLAYVNPAFMRILGYEQAEELLGKPIDELLPHPTGDQGRLAAMLVGRSRVREVSLKRRDGALAHVQIAASVVKDAEDTPIQLMASLLDVTEQRRIQRELEESETRFRQLAGSLRDVFWLYDFDQGRQVYVSPAFSALWGRPVEDLMNDPAVFNRSVHPDDRAAVEEIIAQQRRAEPTEGEYRVIRPDGTVRWVHDRSFPVPDPTGATHRAAGITVDITEQRLAQDRERQHALEMAMIARVAGRVSADLDLNTVLETVCAEAAGALQSPAVAVFLFSEETRAFNLGMTSGPRADFAALLRMKLDAARLRALMNEPPVYAVRDAQTLPDSGNRAVYVQYRVRSALVAKLVYRGALIGTLAAYTLDAPRDFSAAEHSLFKALADISAQAIANAQLYGQIGERQLLIEALSERLDQTSELERREIANELHEQIGPPLTVLGLNLSMLNSDLPADVRARVAPHFDNARALVNEAMDRVRGVMADLRPPVLDSYGVLAALRWHAARLATQAGIEVTVSGPEDFPRLAQDSEIALFRIAQEALTNVVKHARANAAQVTLEVQAARIRMTITDHGLGMDPARAIVRGSDHGWGLLIMRERATSRGGSLDVVSQPGSGTRIMVDLPGGMG